MTSQYREPLEEERKALDAFAAEHGRKWKSELTNVYWYNARIWRGPESDMGYVLHRVRNDLGPDWLRSYKPRRG